MTDRFALFTYLAIGACVLAMIPTAAFAIHCIRMLAYYS